MNVNIFKTKSPQNAPAAGLPKDEGAPAKDDKKTYVQFGKDECATAHGNLDAFCAHLNKVYQSERLRQAKDKKLQEELREGLRKKKETEENEKQAEENRLNKVTIDITNRKDQQKDMEGDLEELKAKDGEINKMARVKLIVGLIILLPLSVYLYNFYIDAFNKGFSGLMNPFTLYFAPLIFFALGFALHFFAVQEGKSKYLKITAILLATFTFDCILAYEIAEAEYNEIAINSPVVMPPYTVAMAAEDPHVLAVLFGGFVAYIIWGIVFDMSMTAYENMRTNKGEIRRCKMKIADMKARIAEKKMEQEDIKKNIACHESRIKEQSSQLLEKIIIDIPKIRTALADFYSGWFTLLEPLGLPKEHCARTKETYENTIGILFPKKD